MGHLTDRMGFTPILPVRWPVTFGTIIKLDRDGIGDSVGTCEQTLSLDVFMFSESQLQYGEPYVVIIILYDTQGTSYSCIGDSRIVTTSGKVLRTKFHIDFEILSNRTTQPSFNMTRQYRPLSLFLFHLRGERLSAQLRPIPPVLKCTITPSF